jgi:hypothetical protein
VRSQSPKVEMIDALFKPLDNGNDDGIIRFDLIYWTIAILYDLRPFYVKSSYKILLSLFIDPNQIKNMH